MRLLRSAILAIGLMGLAAACGGNSKGAEEPVAPAGENPCAMDENPCDMGMDADDNPCAMDENPCAMDEDGDEW